jgi:hypothetical protein
MGVFWVVAPCSLVEVYRRFRCACCLHHHGDDGGSKHFWNVGKLLADYTTIKKRAIFILAAVKTWNLTDYNLLWWNHETCEQFDQMLWKAGRLRRKVNTCGNYSVVTLLHLEHIISQTRNYTRFRVQTFIQRGAMPNSSRCVRLEVARCDGRLRRHGIVPNPAHRRDASAISLTQL